MNRITVAVIGALVILAAMVALLLARPKAVASPSPPSPEQTAVDSPASRSDPVSAEIRIRPSPFDPAAEQPREDDLARLRRHHALVSSVSHLLGERPTQGLLDKRLSDADLEALRAKIDELELRNRQLEMEYRTAGYKRLEEVYAAGGWSVWEERMVTIPYPGKPGEFITRNASPYDDKVEDEMISETGANDAEGKLVRRVVRLRPDNDAVWGAYVAAHRPKVEELRREVRSTVDTYFGK